MLYYNNCITHNIVYVYIQNILLTNYTLLKRKVKWTSHIFYDIPMYYIIQNLKLTYIISTYPMKKIVQLYI